MSQRQIRVAHHHFWDGFQIGDMERRFPMLARKYKLVPDQERPQLVMVSVFPGNRFHAPPNQDVPTLFLTGEDVAPDMTGCDFAISFSRTIADPRHLRVPNWIQRFHAAGLSPRDLLIAHQKRGEPGARFCSFIHRNPVSLREEFVRILARRAPVDCPGLSMNNMPAIGPSLAEKLDFLAGRRFCVTFENAATPGYSTEKLPEALLAGTVPIYWGDPLVGLDFNPEAFLNLADHASLEDLADAVMAVASDPAALRRLREQPAFAGDRLPDCADEERIFAFWESILDRIPESGARLRPASMTAQVDEDFRAAAGDTSRIGFHGDRHLVRAVARALEDATLFVETGSNEGASLAYTASLRPDLPMRSCEPSDTGLAKARERCAPYPHVRISGQPSPDALFDVISEFPDLAEQRPVFWLDAHAHGVPLPLDQEVALLTSAYPRGHMFIDDFQVPDRPWFGFDAYPDGTISLEYVLPHLDRMQTYTVTVPRYRERTSTHHPLRGWCCISWNMPPNDVFADQQLYETIPLTETQPPATAPAPVEAPPLVTASDKAVVDWLGSGTYVDEQRRILYVETPKCACTSIKYLLRGMATGSPLAFNPETPETKPEMMIHDRAQIPLPPLTAYSGQTLADIAQGDGWFRFCVVRHPLERFFSAWRDKVFLCEPGFERYITPGRRYVDFADFYRRVVGQENVLTCDVHWRAQTALLLPNDIRYSRIYTLGNLSDLTTDLAHHLARIGQPASLPATLPRHNEGFSLSSAGFLTPDVVIGLREFYRIDFEQFDFPEAKMAFAPDRSAAELTNQFTDAVFDRNRVIATHWTWHQQARQG